MMIQLKNKYIKVEVLLKGAELKSLKRIDDDMEYMWTADPMHWKRHAPVLFPIVGKVVNGEYRVHGETYKLGQHGFARDMDFEVTNHRQTQATFRLKANDETRKVYPYKFEFSITYTLEKNKVIIEYKVNNTDNQAIYFSVGAHPGFNCPLKSGESFDDYYFEFDEKEDTAIIPVNADGLLQRERKQYLDNENIIELKNNPFKHDALVFEYLKSKNIALKSRKSDYSVRVNFEQFPFLGLWTKSSGAPFVCIEPWIGHADYADFEGEFSEKEDQIRLEVSQEFKREFSISVE